MDTELKLLKEKKPLSSSSKLLLQDVFLDSSDIIQAGIRLSQHQSLHFDSNYHMLLLKYHVVTKFLIKYVREQHLHAGT